jgi:predicted dehydrogenase
MNNYSRRRFLKSAVAGGTALAWSARSWAQVAGANSRVRVATIGLRGRGKNHLEGLRKLKDESVSIVALCDVDRDVLAAARAGLEKQGIKADGYADTRKLLERKDLDAVTIATPNHWHALGAIWAIQSGRDVYVEKPVSHNVWEGRKIVEAARKYQRIVQTGTQCRSSHAIRDAVAWVREGNLGRIQIARGLCYNQRGAIGKSGGPQPIPPQLDYDLWSGPAQLEPPHRNNPKFGPVHYDWHWFWSYGNGDVGNQGIHQMDIARWFLGENALSPRVVSVGGRLGYTDDAETPNTQVVFHDYARAPLIFEVRGLPSRREVKEMDVYKGGKVAVVVECEHGHVLVPNYTSAQAVDAQGNVIKKWEGASDHYANFIAAVKSRRTADLHADILEGHLSSALCHTGNISHQLGRKAPAAAIREEIKGDRDALPTFERMREHLAANGVDIEHEQLTLGPVLRMNTKAERFIGNAAADALLTRNYRAPFVVPEIV